MGEEKILNYKKEYQNGIMQLKIQYLNDGSEVYRTTCDSEEQVITETRDGKEKITVNYLERKVNAEGLLTYEFVSPAKPQTAGSYEIFSREVLNKPDDFFKENFSK